MVRSVEINAAAHFWGYTDEWPDAEMTESLQRAREVLAAGIAQLAIEKARRRVTAVDPEQTIDKWSG